MDRSFSKRCVICFFFIAVLFFICILRVAVCSVSDVAAVQEAQSSYRLSAGRVRGTIYDCHLVPLTNSESETVAAVSPTPRAVTAISEVLEGEDLQNVLERLSSGKPVLCTVPHAIECDGIACTTVYREPMQNTAVHLLGYTDDSGHGVSGIEKAYDDYLYSGEEVSFVYTVNGLGGILEGVAPNIENNTAKVAGGVVTTLDINIQNIAEQEAQALATGAVVVAECETGKIRAMVSRPAFEAANRAAYLNAPDSPFLNRALAAYNVGSVFKPCVAAAGLESGNGEFCYECTGSFYIIDRDFRCHKRDGHGLMNLKSGLANSCNTFFYNFAFLIGEENIRKMAAGLNFGSSFLIGRDLACAPGSLPDRQTLSNAAQLANFSIGQGALSVSPVAMLNLYSAIASGGGYRLPSVIEGTLENGDLTPYPSGKITRVMSEKTAAILREDLAAVISEGTGSSAAPETVSAAGKTATAQTGKTANGKEICEGWFCGFFPCEQPRYTVIVFSENTDRQSAGCGEIFARIADRITALKG